MAIPSQTIEQVAAANDIVEVISAYFPLKRAGSSFKALCPFHQEKTPSFHVNAQRQTFHCFGCGVGGSVFRFVMDYEHTDFPAAVRKLAARVGMPIVEERGANAGEDRQHEARRTLLQLHAETAEWFHENLMKKDFAKSAREYLKEREIDNRIAKNWQIGYAPDEWDAFLKWAQKRGYERRHILQSGLVKPRDEEKPEGDVYDRFRGRIMFPICNDIGEVVAFSGRVLKKEAEAAKYINSPETPLFRKGSVLFGLHKTKRALIDASCAIICEGQLDLITLFEAGIPNVVAPQGTAFTENQARVLKRFVTDVILCFDADSAGQKAAERSLDALLQNDLIVRVAEMPAGEDPDSLVRRAGKVEFEKRIAAARDFFDYWIEHEVASANLDSMGAKIDIARKLGQTISRVHDPMMRSEVVSKASARLGVSRADFENVIPKQSREWTQRSKSTAPTVAPPPPHDVAMLCLLALRDEEARQFLREQNWRETLAQVPEASLLTQILESELRPDDAASLNGFMASLSAAEEGLVSAWLLQRLPGNPATVAEEWWRGLRKAGLRRQLDVAESRMKLPQLSTGDVVNLQKQILDLREQLHELSQFSPAPTVDR
ncbi:MAG: DNA primase [Spartobacteria bacterium]